MTRPLCVTNYAQQSLCVMKTSSITHKKVCVYSMTGKCFMSEAWVVIRTPAKSGGLPNNLLTLPTNLPDILASLLPNLRGLPPNLPPLPDMSGPLPDMPGPLPTMAESIPTNLLGRSEVSDNGVTRETVSINQPRFIGDSRNIRSNNGRT
jgi:hypothetical protein